MTAIPFVGRGEELEVLARHLQDARAGRGGLVLLGGEAGAGKSALVTAALERAGGVRRAVGLCPGPGETPPYDPFVQVVNRLHREHGPVPAELPPPFGEAPGNWSARDRAAALVHWLASGGGPVVVVIEDLHWADEASLTLLRHITPLLMDAPVLLIATYRTDELDREHPLWRLLPELARTGAHRVLLSPLSREDVAGLIAVVLPEAAGDPEVAALVWSRTGGLALFVRELLEAFARTGQILRPGDPLPQTIQQAIDTKMTRLSPAAQLALEAAAVCGERFSFDLLARVVDVEEDALAGALEEAVSRHVITPVDGEGIGFAFDHALYREALLARLIGARRRRWHRRIGEALAAERGADPDVVAHHLYRAGDPRAVDYLVQAGDRARGTGAEAGAARRYAQALEMAEPGDPRRPELLLKLGQCLMWDDPDRAESAWREAESCGDAAASIWASFFRLTLAHLRHDARCRQWAESLMPEQERLLGDREYQRLERELFGSVAGYPRAALPLILSLATSGELAAAEAVFRSVRGRIAPGAVDVGLLRAGFSLALIGGRLDEAAALCGQGADAALAKGAYREALMLRSNEVLVRLVGDASRPEEIDALASQLGRLEEEAWERTGTTLVAPGHSLCGIYHFFRGDWRAALHHVVEGVERNHVAFGGTLMWYAVRVLLDLGEVGRAGQLIQLIPPQRPDDPVPSGNNLMVLPHALKARYFLESGDAAAARTWLQAAEGWPALPSAPIFRAVVRLGWAALHRAEGRLEEAWAAASEALAAAREAGSTLEQIEAHVALGVLAAHRGLPEDAARHFDEALALAAQARFRMAEVLIRRERATSLPDLPGAAEDLRAARELLAEVRAVLRKDGGSAAEEVAVSLAVPGGSADGPPGGSPGGEPGAPKGALPDGLTEREVEVITLVAAGLTNKEIGARLYISPKTVDRHLRNIFLKVSVSNRAALVAYAIRQGLVG
nr:helix-turn-helix transcriptional regulator [Symbiobacterium terraclitae]